MSFYFIILNDNEVTGPAEIGLGVGFGRLTELHPGRMVAMRYGGVGSSVQELPLSVSWRAQMLDAVIFAGACVAASRGQGHPAAKMNLLREVHLCGLSPRGVSSEGPPTDVIAQFEIYLRLASDPVRVRRLLARKMDPFVGTPWAATVLRIAETIAQAPAPLALPSERAATTLRALRISLGLCYPNDCGPPAPIKS